jgi:hypothetical protein
MTRRKQTATEMVEMGCFAKSWGPVFLDRESNLDLINRSLVGKEIRRA